MKSAGKHPGWQCIGENARTEPSTLLEVLEELSVDETLGALVEGRVDGDDVALGDELLEVLDAAGVDGLLELGRELVVVEVEVLLAVEGLETLENAVADAASADGANDLALDVEGVAGDVGDLPVAAADHLQYTCQLNHGKERLNRGS